MDYLAVKQAGSAAVRRYHDMVANGQTPRMAALLATRKPPGTGITDQTVTRNTVTLAEQLKNNPETLALYRRNYKAATGEKLPDDAVAFRSLVKYPGDPRYILTHKNSLDQIKRNAKDDNLHVEGDWENHPRSEAPRPIVTPMNATAMARYKAMYRNEPDNNLSRLSDPELEEFIIDAHAPKGVTADSVMSTPTSLAELARKVWGS